MPASGANEPVARGTGFHDSEFSGVDAVRAANLLAIRRFHPLHGHGSPEKMYVGWR